LQNQIFRYLQDQTPLQIWLYDQKDTTIEGQLIGFDEFMNVTIDGAAEVSLKNKTRKPLGRILLKGDNITLMAPAPGHA
jgi:small nuclear ribonucleoprotein E